MNIYIQITGYIGGVCTTFCLVPQLLKLISSRSAQDISLMTYVILMIGQIAWLLYGVLMQDQPLIITNMVSIVLTMSIVFLTCIYQTQIPEIEPVD